MFSRKKIFASILFILIVFNVLILSVFHRWPSLNSFMRPVVLAVVAPFQEYTHNLLSVLSNLVNHYAFMVSATEENESLKKELQLQANLRVEHVETKLENLRFRDLLELKSRISQQSVAAEVIACDPSSMTRTVIINKGSKNGISEKSPVVNSMGVVGLVTEVIAGYSRVLLITDPRSSIDAFVQKSDIRGVVEGCGNNLCSLEYILKKSKVNIGDVLVSSGMDGIFPKGISIGVVSKVDYCISGLLKTVSVDPCVALDVVQDVLVIVPRPNSSCDF